MLDKVGPWVNENTHLAIIPSIILIDIRVLIEVLKLKLASVSTFYVAALDGDPSCIKHQSDFIKLFYSCLGIFCTLR